MVKNFKTYISFILYTGAIVWCPMSSLNISDFLPLDMIVDKKPDKRVTKHSIPQSEVNNFDVIPVMDPQSQTTQSRRLVLLDSMFGDMDLGK
ncbi:hypothetical protein AYI69_g7077 [Smittium culicis]|uniref:Uncharacterized protein n=1 Tax=Smittium culicis TaxID=133412 RepID=A0A1R1XUK8_9FUNG|nr:hypothetical protein AYI69_g7077 [Smittium culicis]